MGISASARSGSAALGASIAVIGSREITAGIEPARRNGKVATLTVGLGHVSTVLGMRLITSIRKPAVRAIATAS